MQYCRVHVFIGGKVQGVYFRQNTVCKAKELNVLGWIRNLKDGRVEAVFEGGKVNVNKLVDWCNAGPKNAIVKKMEIFTGKFDT